jgi:hypothetical protein
MGILRFKGMHVLCNTVLSKPLGKEEMLVSIDLAGGYFASRFRGRTRSKAAFGFMGKTSLRAVSYNGRVGCLCCEAKSVGTGVIISLLLLQAASFISSLIKNKKANHSHGHFSK